MTIYIKTNDISPETVEDTSLLERLREIDLKCHYHSERRLADVEKECFMCFVDLRRYKDSNVSLRSGGIVGLSYWFKMIILALINPDNATLKHKLERIKTFVLTDEETFISLLENLPKPLITSVANTILNLKYVEERNNTREAMNNYIGTEINKLIKDYNRTKKLKAHIK